MLEGIETLVTFFCQLHHWLEGEEIMVGEIAKMDTPSDYFFGGTQAHSLGKAINNHHPLETSFSTCGGLFHPHIMAKTRMAPSVISLVEISQNVTSQFTTTCEL
jgi:hypothetical protein